MSTQNVRKLDDREKARTKLPVFFGSYDNFTHGLIEILANARDEILNNFDTGIVKVKVHDDLQTLEVFDSGRGIPLMYETDGQMNYVLLFETLFAGGNFDNLGTDKMTTGQNGCGFTCLNYTSNICEITSYKDHKAYTVRYKNGGEFVDYNIEDSKVEHGTKVKWKLDDTIYTSITYDIDYIRDILNKLSSTTPRITYELIYQGEHTKYHYSDSVDYMKNNVVDTLSEFITFNPKTFTENIKKEGSDYIETDIIHAVISISSEPIHQTFLNGTYLREHGTILDGVIEGLRKVFNSEFKNKTITVQDIAMSFNIYATLDSTNPIFHAQTKFSASNNLYKKICSKYIVDNMETIKAEKPKLFNDIKKHLEQINTFNTNNNDKAKKFKKTISEKVNIVNRVKKFVDCRSKKVSERELFIVEGDSALGSCKLGRDSNFQALMPVRGKILNCLKADVTKALESEIIVDLIKVLGCGVESKSKKNKEFNTFDINSLKYDKVIICTDADVDGFQIRTLILTMIYTLMPTLIKEGKVYIVETPLYEIETKNKSYFAYTDNEKEQIVSNIHEKYKVHRSKGLGENNAEMMWETTMNPETRKLTQVTIDNVKKMNSSFELFLGDDIQKRKSFIEKNGYKYI